MNIKNLFGGFVFLVCLSFGFSYFDSNNLNIAAYSNNGINPNNSGLRDNTEGYGRFLRREFPAVANLPRIPSVDSLFGDGEFDADVAVLEEVSNFSSNNRDENFENRENQRINLDGLFYSVDRITQSIQDDSIFVY